MRGVPQHAETPEAGVMRRALTIIPKPTPWSRSVLGPAEGLSGPLIKGSGRVDLVCGECTEILAAGVADQQLQNLVLRCPSCGAYNETS